VAPTFLVGCNTVEETGLSVGIVALDLDEDGGRDLNGDFVDFPPFTGDTVACVVCNVFGFFVDLDMTGFTLFGVGTMVALSFWTGNIVLGFFVEVNTGPFVD
jgi:hypothetical protein